MTLTATMVLAAKVQEEILADSTGQQERAVSKAQVDATAAMAAKEGIMEEART